MIDYALFLIGGYLIGSIPFGLILSKLSGHGDIRKIGSGNIGATNVLRTGNKWLALATLILDGGKGAFAVLLASPAINFLAEAMHYQRDITHAGQTVLAENGVVLFTPFVTIHILLILGLGAILGHCFPVWIKFKGGKGVATALGTLLAAIPIVGLIAIAAWLITAFISRISSLSALVAIAIAPIATFFLYGATPALIVFFIAALVWMRHKDNIKRILNGTEPRIGKKKSSP